METLIKKLEEICNFLIGFEFKQTQTNLSSSEYKLYNLQPDSKLYIIEYNIKNSPFGLAYKLGTTTRNLITAWPLKNPLIYGYKFLCEEDPGIEDSLNELHELIKTYFARIAAGFEQSEQGLRWLIDRKKLISTSNVL